MQASNANSESCSSVVFCVHIEYDDMIKSWTSFTLFESTCIGQLARESKGNQIILELISIFQKSTTTSFCSDSELKWKLNYCDDEVYKKTKHAKLFFYSFSSFITLPSLHWTWEKIAEQSLPVRDLPFPLIILVPRACFMKDCQFPLIF